METLVTNKVFLVLRSQLTKMEHQERIVNKAHELFMKFGIRSVSMDEIANHLGMSKKTIYQFYEDKDALVEDVINIEINLNRTECLAQKQKSEDAIHEFFLAMDSVKEMLSNMNPAVIFDLEKYHTGAFKKYNDHKHKFLYSVIQENLEWGKKEGLYRPEINVDIIARYRLHSMFLIFNQDLFPLRKHHLTELLAEITDHFLYGVSTHKGEKLIQKYMLQRQKTTNV